MFQTAFEGVLDAVIFEEVEEANERHPTPEHRIFPISQGDLLEAGSDDTSPQANYTGDKWGKYLRAPDVYWTIIEKGKDKLVRLGDVAEVKRGFTTGANEFFYLDDQRIQEWGIEDEFLKPVIKSPQECRSILIDSSQLKFKLFMCGADKADLAGTAALEYIEWGESEGFDQRPSCRGRARWWDVGVRTSSQLFWPYIMRERLFCAYGEGGVYVDCNLFDIYANDDPYLLGALCNTTLTILLNELSCRTYGGGGGPLKNQVYEVKALPIVSPDVLESNTVSELRDGLIVMGERKILSIFSEIHQSDRRALDALIFDVLNLTPGERDGVYEAVIHLVETRLQKAQSLRGS